MAPTLVDIPNFLVYLFLNFFGNLVNPHIPHQNKETKLRAPVMLIIVWKVFTASYVQPVIQQQV